MCELTGSFSLAPEVSRKRIGLFFFFFSGYLGVVDKEDRAFCSLWLLLELSGKWGSLNLDREKVSPQWQITCLDRRVEFSFYCWWSGPFRSPPNYLLFVLGETVMTAEPVCVAVSLTSPCFWLGASNMLLFSNKWGAGIAHGGHAVYSCQDNSQAAARLEFDLHTSARSAAGMVGRKCLWLRFTDSYGLFTGVFCSEEWCLKQKHVMYSVWEEHPDRHLKQAAAGRRTEKEFVQERNRNYYLWESLLESFSGFQLSLLYFWVNCELWQCRF